MKRIFSLLALAFQIQLTAQNPLFIPDTLSGTNIQLTLQTGTHPFFSGQPTNTMGANGDILGPTLILNRGDSVNFSVTNQLPDSTTLHWHGLHVAPQNDGGPHIVIPQNTTWTPGFKIRDRASTHWYHPHLHHKTNKHVSLGIAGLIIVRDSNEANLNLPRIYGVDDIPLVIQTKDFDSNNQIMVHSNNDDVLMVNATLGPFVEVPAQMVRFRILNGSSQRVFNLGLSTNENFHQIASDAGLLSSPYQTNRLMLAPGERAEILVNLSGKNGQTVYLRSFASEFPNGIYGATFPGMGQGMTMTGYNPNPLNGTDFDVLKIDVIPQTAQPITSVPGALANVQRLLESNFNTTRVLTFRPETMGPNQLNGRFTINNTFFDMGVINYTIPFENTEVWELRNQSGIAHPFHIHMVPFFILDRNGAPPTPSEQGLKDVVLVQPQEVVRIITRFETFHNPVMPYMYHCHMLTHEDDGMMGQFVVVKQISVTEHSYNNEILVYPNPSLGSITVEWNYLDVEMVSIMDASGRETQSIKVDSEYALQIRGLSPGLHFVQLLGKNDVNVIRVIVQ